MAATFSIASRSKSIHHLHSKATTLIIGWNWPLVTRKSETWWSLASLWQGGGCSSLWVARYNEKQADFFVATEATTIMASPRKHVFFTKDLQTSSPLARRVANGVKIGQQTARKISTHVFGEAKQRDFTANATEVAKWAKGMFGTQITGRRIITDFNRYGAGKTPDLVSKRGPRKRKDKTKSPDKQLADNADKENALKPVGTNNPNHSGTRDAGCFQFATVEDTLNDLSEYQMNFPAPPSPVITRNPVQPPTRSYCQGILGKGRHYDPWIVDQLRLIFNSGISFDFSTICEKTLLNVLNENVLSRDRIMLQKEDGMPIFRSIVCSYITEGWSTRCHSCDEQFVRRKLEQDVRKINNCPEERKQYRKSMKDTYVASDPYLSIQAIKSLKREKESLRKKLYRSKVERRVNHTNGVVIQGADKADLLKRAMKMASDNMEEVYPPDQYGPEHQLFYAFT